MLKLSISILAAAAGVLATAPMTLAGDLGDGGYGARTYGQHRPYYSGQDSYADRNGYRQDNDDDDDDQAYGKDNDDDDDDNTGNDDEDRRDGDHAYRHNGSVKDGDYEPAPHAGIVRPYRGNCVPGWRVKQRLVGEGWSHFRLNTYGRGVAVVRATRVHTGRPFVLRIDGCTGETLSSTPAGLRRYSSRD